MVKMPSVTIQITPQVADYLQRLVATGLWGKNVHEAAQRLVERGIEGLLGSRVLGGKP